MPDRGVIFLRYDVGPGRGLGHRSRMDALVPELERLGWRCDSASVVDGLPGRGVALVVDSYDVRADQVRFEGGPVVAIDDLDRDLAVDLLVEPSPSSATTGGTRVTGRARSILAGFEYALVGGDHAWPAVVAAGAQPQVHVSLGGSDSDGRGAAICDRLVATVPDVQVLHVPGPWSLAASHPDVVVAARDVRLMSLLRSATVVVCAGGVTMLESLMLGRPTVAVETADNQHRAVAGAAAVGAAIVPGSAAPSVVCDAVESILSDPTLAGVLASRGPRVVDGLGARRVAERIDEMLGHPPN